MSAISLLVIPKENLLLLGTSVGDGGLSDASFSETVLTAVANSADGEIEISLASASASTATPEQSSADLFGTGMIAITLLAMCRKLAPFRACR